VDPGGTDPADPTSGDTADTVEPVAVLQPAATAFRVEFPVELAVVLPVELLVVLPLGFSVAPAPAVAVDDGHAGAAVALGVPRLAAGHQ
jgi:hypothetical protein